MSRNLICFNVFVHNAYENPFLESIFYLIPGRSRLNVHPTCSVCLFDYTGVTGTHMFPPRRSADDVNVKNSEDLT